MGFIRHHPWTTLLCAFLLMLGVIFASGTVDFSGDFSRKFGKREFQPMGQVNPDDAMNPYGRARDMSLLGEQPDSIRIFRSTGEKVDFPYEKIGNITPETSLIQTQYSICVDGKTNATIEQLAFDVHAQAEFYFDTYVGPKKIWSTPAGYYFPPTKDEAIPVGKKSYTINGPFTISAGKCEKLTLYLTKLDVSSQWILPMFKGIKATLPATFSDNPSSGAGPFQTSLTPYLNKTTFGYGTLIKMQAQKNGPGGGSGTSVEAAGYDPVQHIYNKILTEKIVVTRMSSAVTDASGTNFPTLGAGKPPLILSTFNVCVKGETDAKVTGMSIHMNAVAGFTFYAGFGSQFLWKDPINFFEEYVPSEGYMNKTFDFLSEKSMTLPAGSCTPLTIFTTKINQKNAKFILPMFENIGSNLAGEFVETYADKTYIRQLGKKNNPQRGHGTLTLFSETKGPIYTEEKQYFNTLMFSGAAKSYSYFRFAQRIGQPVKISDFSFVLQTNYDKPVKVDFKIRRTFNSGIFGQSWPRAPLAETALTAMVPPNQLFTLPLTMQLGALEELDIEPMLHLPAVSATYLPRLQSVGSNSAETLITPWLNSIFSNAVKPFIGIDDQKIIVTIPGQEQPGELPIWGKIPDAKKKTDQDLAEAKTKEEFVEIAKELHSLKFSAWLPWPSNYTLPQVKNEISKKGGHLLANLAFESVDSLLGYQYVPKKTTFMLKSNLPTPLKIGIDAGQFSKEIIVLPNKPFDLVLPSFQNYFGMTMNLKEFPVTSKLDFYIEPIVVKAEFAYEKNGALSAAMTTPLVQIGGDKGSIVSFPHSMGTIEYSSGGLFEHSNNNIGPPFKKIVDIATMNPNSDITMNSFCLKALEKATVNKLVFDHIARDTSPFSMVSLDMGFSKAFLQKNGWSKHEAVFGLTTPVEMSAGNVYCFDLKVKGPVEEELDGAYFDLIEIGAQNGSGAPIETYLKSGQTISKTHPLKGTQFDFF